MAVPCYFCADPLLKGADEKESEYIIIEGETFCKTCKRRFEYLHLKKIASEKEKENEKKSLRAIEIKLEHHSNMLHNLLKRIKEGEKMWTKY